MATQPRTQNKPTSGGKPSTAVAVKAGTALAQPIPEFMQGQRGMGVENIGVGDIETPRIKLLQAVSPECEQFDDAKPGHFWHTIAEKSLGKELRIVPVYVDLRAILWRPRWDGGGILARADDGIHWSPPSGEFEIHPSKDNKKHTVKWVLKPTVAESGLLDWGSHDPSDPNSQPAATRMYNVAVALPDHPDLGAAVLTLQRSGVRPARKFMGKLKLMPVPSFGAYFKMGSVSEDNKSGDSFLNYTFTADGLVQEPEEFYAYKELYEGFKSMGLQIKDLENAQEEQPDAAGASEDKDAGGKGKRPSY